MCWAIRMNDAWLLLFFSNVWKYFVDWNSSSRNSKKWRKRRRTSAARRRASRLPALPTARRRHQRRRLVWPTRPRPAPMPRPSTAARPWPLWDWAVEPLLPPLLTTIRSRWPSNKNVSVNNILAPLFFYYFFLPITIQQRERMDWALLLYCFRNVRLDPWDAMEWAKRKKKEGKR